MGQAPGSRAVRLPWGLWFAGIAVFTTPAAPAAPSGGGVDAEYAVRMSHVDRRIVKVDAAFRGRVDEISMSPTGAAHKERGWAEFVYDLVATDADGRRVALVDRGGGRFELAPTDGLVISYEVHIEHDFEAWPFGWDQAAYVKDDCVYFTTGTVFLAPTNLESAVVTFQLPRTWLVSCSWEELGEDYGVYRVDGYLELTRSCVLIGEHEEQRIRARGIEVIVAVGQDLAPALPEIRGTLELALHEAVTFFGETPDDRFILIANLADYYGGSGHVGGVSMVFDRLPGEEEPIWAHVVVHELLHLWNGVRIRREDHRGDWFNEGVTDYLTVLLLARLGIGGEEFALERLARSYDMYESNVGETSLADAGIDKIGNYDLLYGGGLFAGLALDLEIRAASDGERSIEDLMRRMLEEFGADGERFTTEDVRRLAREVAGRDLSRLFRSYVTGKNEIPVEDYLGQMGLRVELEPIDRKRGITVVRRDPKTDPAVERLRVQVLGF